jgi:hypothetical protein
LATCEHCHAHHTDAFAAGACCLFAPKKPTGWCAWCGRDCPGTFCCRPCAVAYRNDVLGSREKPPPGWCAWCGRDCVGVFCNARCEKAHRRDKSKAA